MVECNLAKVDVASSSLVSRSKVWRVSKAVMQRIANSSSPVRLWNAPPSKMCLCPSGEIGRHKGFKIPRNLYFRASSILASGTILITSFKALHLNYTCLLFLGFKLWLICVFEKCMYRIISRSKFSCLVFFSGSLRPKLCCNSYV